MTKKATAKKVPVDDLIGDKNSIEVTVDQANERYLIKFTDKVIGNSAYVRFDLKRGLGEAMQWDAQATAFVVSAADYNKLKPAVEEARKRTAEITKSRQEMEQVLSFDLTDKEGEIIRFMTAFTQEGKRFNGEILRTDKYFVAQFNGIGKDGTKYVQLHGTDKFMKTQEDWRDIEAALAKQFDIGEKVSIVYGEKNKALVQDYVPTQKAAKPQEHSMSV